MGVGHGEGALGASRRWCIIGGAVDEAVDIKQAVPRALAFADGGTFSTAAQGRTGAPAAHDGLFSGPVHIGGP